MKLIKHNIGDVEVFKCKYDMDYSRLDSISKVNEIYIHNAGSYYSDLDKLNDVHRARNFAAIGYHICIDKEGQIYLTRPLQFMGAHIRGKNRNSFGIGFFGLEECVKSEKVKANFSKLINELESLSGSKLEIRSHAEGQINYINELISYYNQNVREAERIPLINYQNDCFQPHNFSDFKKRAEESLNGSRQHSAPFLKHLFAKISTQIKNIKNCGVHYYLLF